jgi:pimeloyl-ACP methyl ester carboxylesterase
MEKHASDLARILDHAEVGRTPFAGVSIGGYVLFEFWRRHRGRVAALALFNTKAPKDPEEKRPHEAAADVERGTGPFPENDSQTTGKTTRRVLDLLSAYDAQNVTPGKRGRYSPGMAERANSMP